MKKAFLLFIFVTFFIGKNLYADSTFVSGTIVSETWTKAGSPYCVIGDILVAGLTIDPGVEVLFLGNYVFEVGGVLTAKGTEQDSIYFTKVDTVDGWQGIYFNNSSPGSEFKYCEIKYSQNSGIRIEESNPIIKKCDISWNSATYGGGINISNSKKDTIIIEECFLYKNTSKYGGGIYAIIDDNDYGLLKLINCEINDNDAIPPVEHGNCVGGGVYISGNAELLQCKVLNNYSKAYYEWSTAALSRGGGIYISSGNIILSNCIVNNNRTYARAINNCGHSYSYGGGLYLNNGSLSAKNSIFGFNKSTSTGSVSLRAWGSGVFINSGSAEILNCTIAYGNSHGIRRENGSVNVLNSIVYFNDGTEISGTATVTYSDVQDGYDGDGNINFNPLFESDDNLQIVEGSLCIDAGNPDQIYNDIEDPNNLGSALYPSLGALRNDMGAHGGPYVYHIPPDNQTPFVASSVSDTTFAEDSSPHTIVDDLNTVFSDPDGDELIFSASSNNPDIQPSIKSDSLFVDSSPNYFGSGNIIVTATDPGGLSAKDTFLVEITPVDDPPFAFNLLSPDSGVTINSSNDSIQFVWNLSEDVDNDTILYDLKIWSQKPDTMIIPDIPDTTKWVDGTGFFVNDVEYEWTVLAKDGFTTISAADTFTFKHILTGIEPLTNLIPEKYSLNQNYPNPFNPVTQIKFGLPKASNVKLEVYNALGQKVATLLNAHKPVGYHEVTFDAGKLASGVYIYRLTTSSGFSQTKKMILMR